MIQIHEGGERDVHFVGKCILAVEDVRWIARLAECPASYAYQVLNPAFWDDRGDVTPALHAGWVVLTKNRPDDSGIPALASWVRSLWLEDRSAVSNA